MAPKAETGTFCIYSVLVLGLKMLTKPWSQITEQRKCLPSQNKNHGGGSGAVNGR